MNARSLALAARGNGAQLFQQSGLESLTRQNHRWLAKTAHGQVSAEQVIIATNAYADRNSEKVDESTVPVFIFHCATEPLAEELAHFVECIRDRSRPRTDGHAGLSVVAALEAAQKSIEAGGDAMPIEA